MIHIDGAVAIQEDCAGMIGSAGSSTSTRGSREATTEFSVSTG